MGKFTLKVNLSATPEIEVYGSECWIKVIKVDGMHD